MEYFIYREYALCRTSINAAISCSVVCIKTAYASAGWYTQGSEEIMSREVELDPQVSPEEIMSREVELDPQVSPEGIMSREVELGCDFASGCYSTAVQRTMSL